MQLSEREMISDRQRGLWEVLLGEKIIFPERIFSPPSVMENTELQSKRSRKTKKNSVL